MSLPVPIDERSPDLHAAFASLWASGGVPERARAHRIWMTCVPTFLSRPGQAPSVAAAVQGLPATPAYDQQRMAYADLFNRCHAFFDADRETLLTENGRLVAMHERGQATTRAAQALAQLAQGDEQTSRASAAAALASGDPNELYELTGLVSARMAAADARDPATVALAATRDAALALAACEMGADCSATSLLAVRMCAFESLCEGDTRDRLRAKYGQGSDPAALAEELARLVTGLRRGSLDPDRYLSGR